VSIYHGKEAAEKAQEQFVRVFQEQGQPEDMETYKLQKGQTVLDVLVDSGLVDSRSQARRLISQNAVRLDEEKLSDPHQKFPGSGVLQVGKRRFIKVK
jgi:tyrosyl-tRNA synthetase